MSCFSLSRSICFNRNILLQATFTERAPLRFPIYWTKAYDSELRFVAVFVELMYSYALSCKSYVSSLLHLTTINTPGLALCRL